jgi:hypothetical protein
MQCVYFRYKGHITKEHKIVISPVEGKYEGTIS